MSATLFKAALSNIFNRVDRVPELKHRRQTTTTPGLTAAGGRNLLAALPVIKSQWEESLRPRVIMLYDDSR